MSSELEALLGRALVPVEPPKALELRLEATLDSLVELAADELEAWELRSMRDPRNWARIGRPAAAILVGTTAAAGLVIVRTQLRRDKRRRESRNVVELAGRTVRDGAQEARKLFRELNPRR